MILANIQDAVSVSVLCIISHSHLPPPDPISDPVWTSFNFNKASSQIEREGTPWLRIMNICHPAAFRNYITNLTGMRKSKLVSHLYIIVNSKLQLVLFLTI